MAPDPKAPLAAFKKLTESIYLSDPKSNLRVGPPVVLAFWMNATPRPVARYVMEYRRILPRSRIVIVLCSTNDFFFNSRDSAQDTRLPAAVDALRTFASPENPAFIHIFSNGGVLKASHLLRLYKRQTGQSLPVSSMIFDSAPGASTISSAVRAISFQLPQFWLWRVCSEAGLWVLMTGLEFFRRIIGAPPAIQIASRRINDLGLYSYSTPALSRCYIYSDADKIISSQDVEEHADESESCGLVVRREKFDDAQHVTSMMTDPERYWSIVEECIRGKLA